MFPLCLGRQPIYILFYMSLNLLNLSVLGIWQEEFFKKIYISKNKKSRLGDLNSQPTGYHEQLLPTNAIAKVYSRLLYD
jgi:chromatin segregation and condensation protein Rec8/ScpA/Scc1 (kleisin family)